MNNEIKSLTGLRGIAAVVVMLYHFFEHDAYYKGYVPSLITRGYLAVDVFFVLSGFVMALSYAKYFKDGITVDDYKAFMLKRLARIYPLYIVITISFVLKHWCFSGNWIGSYELITCALMIQAWGTGITSLAGATWSLSAEFFAYIIFPALVFCTVFGRPAYAVAVLVLCAACLWLIASSGLGVSGPLDVVAASSILPVLRCLAGFCLGLITYRLSQLDAVREFFSSSAVVIALLAGLLFGAHYRAHDLMLFAFFPVIVAALFFEAASARLIFAARPVYHLGLISYSLYLVHQLFEPVKVRLEPVAEKHFGNVAHPLTLALVIILSWACACVLYRFIELPGRLYVQRLSSAEGRAGSLAMKVRELFLWAVVVVASVGLFSIVALWFVIAWVSFRAGAI